eukprot:13756587-Alexandrium_andersonii.AAC.1
MVNRDQTPRLANPCGFPCVGVGGGVGAPGLCNPRFRLFGKSPNWRPWGGGVRSPSCVASAALQVGRW